MILAKSVVLSGKRHREYFVHSNRNLRRSPDYNVTDITNFANAKRDALNRTTSVSTVVSINFVLN